MHRINGEISVVLFNLWQKMIIRADIIILTITKYSTFQEKGSHQTQIRVFQLNRRSNQATTLAYLGRRTLLINDGQVKD